MSQLDIPQFDIFRMREGALLWCCSAKTFEQAEAKARIIAQTDHCDHMILDQVTGHQTTVKA